jgi:hypothetical protein
MFEQEGDAPLYIPHFRGKLEVKQTLNQSFP